jgi:hypothetical protein
MNMINNSYIIYIMIDVSFPKSYAGPKPLYGIWPSRPPKENGEIILIIIIIIIWLPYLEEGRDLEGLSFTTTLAPL